MFLPIEYPVYTCILYLYTCTSMLLHVRPAITISTQTHLNIFSLIFENSFILTQILYFI